MGGRWRQIWTHSDADHSDVNAMGQWRHASEMLIDKHVVPDSRSFLLNQTRRLLHQSAHPSLSPRIHSRVLFEANTSFYTNKLPG
jgi:hypothetical protein